jgi:hypothetical protein
VSGNLLGPIKRAASFSVERYASGAKAVIGDLVVEACRRSRPFHPFKGGKTRACSTFGM